MLSGAAVTKIMPTRVLLVEDHPLVAAGLAVALEASGFEVVEHARTLAEAREALARGRARALGVAIVDVALPDGSGLDLVSALSAARIPSVILTGQTTAARVREARARGALGFVAKTARLEMVLEALRAAMRGEPFLCTEARSALAEAAGEVQLTPRECEVLTLIAAGRTNKQIAALLGVAPRTAETHRERLMQKLGAHNAADLTRAAVTRGLVQPP